MNELVRKIQRIGRIAGCLLALGGGTDNLFCQIARTDSLDKIWERDRFLFKTADSVKKLVDQGETYRVINLSNVAQDLLKPGIISRYEGYLLNYKGSVYLRIGNYYLSKKCFKLVQAYGRKFEEKDLIGTSTNNLGVLALETKDFGQAEEIFKSLIDKQSIFYDHALRTPSLINLADLAILNVDTMACKTWFSMLSPLLKTSNDYLLDRNYGIYQMMIKHYLIAKHYLKRALNNSLISNIPNHYQTGLCFYHLAECYHILGLRDSAEICYEEASQILSSATINGVSRIAEVLPNYETVLIECLIKQGEFLSENPETMQAALEKFTAAINRLLFLSHAITAESTRFIIAEKGRSAFNKGIACALQLFEQYRDTRYLDQAFEWSLQSKSLSLNWLVEKDLVYARVGIPAELAGKLQTYRRILDELLGDSLNFTVQVPLDSIGRVIRLYEETEKQISLKYEEIRKGMDENPIISRITGKTFGKERYLGYYDLDTLIIVFGVTPKGRSYIRIPKDSLLISRINRFREILASPPHGVYGSREISDFSDLSLFLFEKLVKPALNGSERGNLAIHPDGILLGFPFEALTTVKIRSNSFKSLPFLMNRFEIRYLTTSLLVRRTWHRNDNRDSISIITCRDAANIPDVTQEVSTIAKKFQHPSIWYLDQPESASLLNDTPGIIHISSHLSVNNPDPLKSGIYCQESGISGLTFKEILNCRLSGSQVFINACESGNGPVNHGEGLMSLGLAFSIAGCSTIIQQIWKAPDHSSAKIAQLYYKYVGKSGPAEAITRSKKEFLKSAKPGADHPYYWAGMVCYSNISDKGRFPQVFWPIMVAGMLGVCLYWFFRKRNLR